jgi:hypothetical protein
MKISIIWKFHFCTKLILDTLKQPGPLVMGTKNSQNNDNSHHDNSGHSAAPPALTDE